MAITVREAEARAEVAPAATAPAPAPAPAGRVPDPAPAYRADIDGLRAIAVLAVLGFHARVPGAAGGFAGVDVFFVVSGFLITGIVQQALAAGRFDYAWFYRRRIRRLFPAWIVLVTATLVAGLVLSLPRELADLGRSLVASSVFATNVLFWRQSGYFATGAAIEPLLHTWSLSVEEQFYLVYPAALWLLARATARTRLACLAAVALASLVAAEAMLRRDANGAFYLLPFRAWELLLGALLVLRPLRWSPRVAAWAGGLGLAAIAAAIGGLARPEQFPGLGALLPCLGAAAVVAAGVQATPVRALLSLAPLTYVGRISYSLYLWHWPLLAYLNYAAIDVPSPWAVAAALALAFACAAASYRWVEQPLRQPTRTPRFRPFVAVALSSAALGAVGAVLVASGGLRAREAPPVLAFADQGVREGGCVPRPGAIDCLLPAGAAKATVALWGDSHAGALAPALADAAAAHGDALRVYREPGCPPVVGVRRDAAGVTVDCDRWSRQVLDALVADPTVRTVVLVARHAVYVGGHAVELGPAEHAGGPRTLLVGADAEADLATGYFRRMDAVLARLRAAGKSIVIVLPVPEVGYDVPTAAALSLRWGRDPRFLDRPRVLYEARQAGIRAELARLAARHGARIVDPAAVLCDARRCHALAGATALYSDDDHLARPGAELVVAPLAALLW